MNLESITAVESFPEHWPLLALSGGSEKERDDLLVEILNILQLRAIRALVVKDDAENGSPQRGGQTCNGNKELLLIGNDTCHIITRKTNNRTLQEVIIPYVASYDIIIVSKDVSPEIDTVLLINETDLHDSVSAETIYVHCQGDDCNDLVDFLWLWLQKKVLSTPVWACVLIGGKSSRMGQPKHLIKEHDGKTWLENCVLRLQEVAVQVVLSGKGEVPISLAQLPRLADINDVKGPVAGILSAMRWNPLVSWLLVACDLPDIQKEGLDWLLSRRKPGVWGTVPLHQQTGYVEPLLAHYDFRSVQFFEKLLLDGCLRIGQISKNAKISTPPIPQGLIHSWRNCNTPDDLMSLK